MNQVRSYRNTPKCMQSVLQFHCGFLDLWEPDNPTFINIRKWVSFLVFFLFYNHATEEASTQTYFNVFNSFRFHFMTGMFPVQDANDRYSVRRPAVIEPKPHSTFQILVVQFIAQLWPFPDCGRMIMMS